MVRAPDGLKAAGAAVGGAGAGAGGVAAAGGGVQRLPALACSQRDTDDGRAERQRRKDAQEDGEEGQQHGGRHIVVFRPNDGLGNPPVQSTPKSAKAQSHPPPRLVFTLMTNHSQAKHNTTTTRSRKGTHTHSLSLTHTHEHTRTRTGWLCSALLVLKVLLEDLVRREAGELGLGFLGLVEGGPCPVALQYGVLAVRRADLSHHRRAVLRRVHARGLEQAPVLVQHGPGRPGGHARVGLVAQWGGGGRRGGGGGGKPGISRGQPGWERERTRQILSMSYELIATVQYSTVQYSTGTRRGRPYYETLILILFGTFSMASLC